MRTYPSVVESYYGFLVRKGSQVCLNPLFFKEVKVLPQLVGRGGFPIGLDSKSWVDHLGRKDCFYFKSQAERRFPCRGLWSCSRHP
ncbi:hypothetical protein GW17_00022135 [Ensete ventricosum]|nr:hypothetical protein GW17_00022135 [Ensete ventricosum]